MGTTVYFATNRVVQNNDRTNVQSYGAEILSPSDASQVLYAVGDVEGIDLGVENSGRIEALHDFNEGGFSKEAIAPILSANKDLLIFIHGFANSFDTAIRRAAFNREWFAAGGEDLSVVAFTWPSIGAFFAVPPHFLADDYKDDQGQAGRSGLHIASFLKNVQGLLGECRKVRPNARAILLAHSMGNYALQASVQSWFDHSYPEGQLFDAAVLAAADERYDSFEFSFPDRLTGLSKLTPNIAIYYSEKDVAMYLSLAVNFISRLGMDGPKDKASGVIYPATEFRFVDCAEVGDYNLIIPPDASHQYYRRSSKVRADIIQVMTGHASGGSVSL